MPQRTRSVRSLIFLLDLRPNGDNVAINDPFQNSSSKTVETWEKWDEQIVPQAVKPLQRKLDLYFFSPEVTLNMTLSKSCHSTQS